jgi:hypothetical protein
MPLLALAVIGLRAMEIDDHHLLGANLTPALGPDPFEARFTDGERVLGSHAGVLKPEPSG